MTKSRWLPYRPISYGMRGTKSDRPREGGGFCQKKVYRFADRPRGAALPRDIVFTRFVGWLLLSPLAVAFNIAWLLLEEAKTCSKKGGKMVLSWLYSLSFSISAPPFSPIKQGSWKTSAIIALHNDLTPGYNRLIEEGWLRSMLPHIGICWGWSLS